jgi:hypothetical protein
VTRLGLFLALFLTPNFAYSALGQAIVGRDAHEGLTLTINGEAARLIYEELHEGRGETV